jgi:hypothetical protein
MRQEGKHFSSFNLKTSGLGRKNAVYILGLFVLSPFLSLLVAIKNYKVSWAKNVVWLFVAFYGYTMVISNEGMDASFYRDDFLRISQLDITIDNFNRLLNTEEESYVDIMQPLISFTISRFTSDHRILFLVFGIVFGYFYSRNIWYLIENTGAGFRKEIIPFIITFAVIVGFWQINGFRMWTAAHIFFFGAIRYLYEGKKQGFLVAALSILVHFSFVLPTVLLVIHLIFKNRVHLFFWLFVATFFISEINLTIVNELLSSFVPDMLLSRVKGYTNEEYAESINQSLQQNSWHAILYGKALRWVIVCFISFIYFRTLRFIKSDNALFTLYSFTLLFMAIANLLSLVPSGGRFSIVASMFAVTVIVLSLCKVPEGNVLKRLVPLGIPALILYCTVALRKGFDTIGITTILGNPLVAIYADIEIALIEFIK